MSKIIESSNSNRWGFPGGTSGKECRRCKRWGSNPRVGKTLWRRKQQPTLVVLPGENHGQRNLADYSPFRSHRVGYDLNDLAHMHSNRYLYTDAQAA